VHRRLLLGIDLRFVVGGTPPWFMVDARSWLMFDVGMEIEMLSFLLAGEGDDMAAQRTIFHGVLTRGRKRSKK